LLAEGCRRALGDTEGADLGKLKAAMVEAIRIIRQNPCRFARLYESVGMS
jgi:hypothetical protein